MRKPALAAIAVPLMNQIGNLPAVLAPVLVLNPIIMQVGRKMFGKNNLPLVVPVVRDPKVMGQLNPEKRLPVPVVLALNVLPRRSLPMKMSHRRPMSITNP
jgi:uncharacterized membrane protein YcfT